MTDRKDAHAGMNALDQLCQDITKAWAALYASNKQDHRTVDIVTLGLQHTAQLIGVIQTLRMVVTGLPGATGKFPDGRLNEDDEGELNMRVSHESCGVVVVEFGKPTTWIGLSAYDVENFCEALMQHAKQAAEEVLKTHGKS